MSPSGGSDSGVQLHIDLGACAATTIDVIPLPATLEPVGWALETIAKAWMAHGARCVTVVDGDDRHIIAGGGLDSAPGIIAPMRIAGAELHLAVTGAVDGARARLEADAALIARLAAREDEVEHLTTELIGANDQMHALHELSTWSTSTIDPGDLPARLAGEAHRLIACGAVAIITADTPVAIAGAHDLRPALVATADQHGADAPTVIVRTAQGVDVDIVLQPLGEHVDGLLAVAGQRGHDLPDTTQPLVEAIAERIGERLHLASISRCDRANAIAERDMQTAAALSMQLLPPATPEVTGADLAARHVPAPVPSGAFVTHETTRDGLVVAIGEASGDGLAAELVMARVSAAMTAAIHRDRTSDPAVILTSSSNELAGYLRQAGMTVAAAVGIWDPRSRTLRLANAGHAGVLHRHAGRTTAVSPTAAPLGTVDERGPVTVSLEFDPTDALVLGSDGLVRQVDEAGVELGHTALAAVVDAGAGQTADHLVERLLGGVERHGAGRPPAGDRTALVLARIAM